jgi:hypothetical protein
MFNQATKTLQDQTTDPVCTHPARIRRIHGGFQADRKPAGSVFFTFGKRVVKTCSQGQFSA